jgi:hypothetical protein
LTYFSQQACQGIRGFFSPVQNAKYIAHETTAAVVAAKDFFKPKK